MRIGEKPRAEEFAQRALEARGYIVIGRDRTYPIGGLAVLGPETKHHQASDAIIVVLQETDFSDWEQQCRFFLGPDHIAKAYAHYYRCIAE